MGQLIRVSISPPENSSLPPLNISMNIEDDDTDDAVITKALQQVCGSDMVARQNWLQALCSGDVRAAIFNPHNATHGKSVPLNRGWSSHV